jgi:hypothetical protein
VPHCPICGLEPTGGRSRCPIDNAFLETFRCADCHREVGWRDRFCGWCGREIAAGGLQAEVVALDRAGPLRVALGHAIDGILVLSLAPVLFSWVLESAILAQWGSLPVCLPFLWIYWILLWSGGRQSLGQFIFRLVTLDPQRLPLSVPAMAYNLSVGLFHRNHPKKTTFWRIQEFPS